MNICEQEYYLIAELCTGKQKEFFQWICATGKAFKGRTLDKKEQDWLQGKVSRKLFKNGLCTIQSQTGVIDGELRYFEGRATSKKVGIPLDHAWLVDKDEKVWDAVWKDGADYFGVEVPASFVRQHMSKTGMATFLLGEYFYTCKGQPVNSPH